MYDEFKPNSHKYREEQKRVPPEKKMEKVVTGEVVTRKKSGIQKFAKALFAEEFNLPDYIYREVVLPGVRDLLYEAAESLLEKVKDGLSSALYGANGRESKSEHRPYRSYYDSGTSRREVKTVSYRHVDYDYDDVIFKKRGDAEETLRELRDNITNYGLTSVANLYDAVGEPCNQTDNDYGWDDLSGARVRPVHGGYIIDLPKPIYIGNI